MDVSDIWPQEREFIENPDRYRYVRKIIQPKGCVFCTASKARPSVKSQLLARQKHSMVVLNKYPYNNGHLLVLPTRHCGQLVDLKKAEYLELMQTLKTTVEVVQKAFDTENLNIGMNQGAVAGAGLPDHLHWHIIPRWFGDTNFFPLIAETKVHPMTQQQVFKKLRPYFKKLGW